MDLWEPHQELSAACHDGLQRLADHETADGATTVADFWRRIDERLELAEPLAGLELCLFIASGLKDLAKYHARAGLPDAAERWATVAEQLQQRAWARERARLGLD